MCVIAEEVFVEVDKIGEASPYCEVVFGECLEVGLDAISRKTGRAMRGRGG